MPESHEFLDSEIPHLCKGLFRIEIAYASDGKNRFKYIDAGKNVTSQMGMDIVGQFVDEVFPADSYRTLQEDYHDAIQTCEPRYMSFLETPCPDSMILLERLLLPLGPKGAARPDSFVGMHVGTAKGRASLEDTCLPFALNNPGNGP